MAKIEQTKILIQYGKENEPGEYRPISKEHAEHFVDLDMASGGYPYATSIDRAFDFKTVEAAERYVGHFKGFHIRNVKVTYEWDE